MIKDILLIDMSAQNNGAGSFEVHMFDIAGYHITIQSTAETLVSSLIEQFRQEARHNGSRLPETSKRKEIFLVRAGNIDGTRLEMGTLRSNGIEANIDLAVFYKGEVACIKPELLAQQLHQWIEGRNIEFSKPFEPVDEHTLHIGRNGLDLFAEYNGWTRGTQYVFFLTNAQLPSLREPMTFTSNTMEENGDINYISTISQFKLPLMVAYYPNGMQQLNNYIKVTDYSSVRGILEDVKITIGQTKGNKPSSIHKYSLEGYTREYVINVILRGPIEIRNANGTIKASFNDPNGMGSINYETILMCDDRGQPNIPNKGNLAGGRRSKRTKRSKNKRKTRRRTRRNRA
jgi:hypothetical protein